jgi:hypothetical protein
METREYMATVANYPFIGLPADVVPEGGGQESLSEEEDEGDNTLGRRLRP